MHTVGNYRVVSIPFFGEEYNVSQDDFWWWSLKEAVFRLVTRKGMYWYEPPPPLLIQMVLYRVTWGLLRVLYMEI